MLNYARFCSLIREWSQEAHPLKLDADNDGLFRLEFRCINDFGHFKAQFENRLSFDEDDARYHWDYKALVFTIDRLI